MTGTIFDPDTYRLAGRPIATSSDADQPALSPEQESTGGTVDTHAPWFDDPALANEYSDAERDYPILKTFRPLLIVLLWIAALIVAFLLVMFGHRTIEGIVLIIALLAYGIAYAVRRIFTLT